MKNIFFFLLATIVIISFSCQKDINIEPVALDSNVVAPVTNDSLVSKIVYKEKFNPDTVITTYKYNSARLLIQDVEEKIITGIRIQTHVTDITRDATGKITKVFYNDPIFGTNTTTTVGYVPGTSKAAYKIMLGSSDKDSVVFQYTGELITRTIYYHSDTTNSGYVVLAKTGYKYDGSGNRIQYLDTTYSSSGQDIVSIVYTYDTKKGVYNYSNTDSHIIEGPLSLTSKNNLLSEAGTSATATSVLTRSYKYNANGRPVSAAEANPYVSDSVYYWYYYK